jgi:hypothetical protein
MGIEKRENERKEVRKQKQKQKAERKRRTDLGNGADFTLTSPRLCKVGE